MDFVLIPFHLPLDYLENRRLERGEKAHPSSGNAGHAADG